MTGARTAVSSALGTYRVAVAELPLRARPATAGETGIAVIAGAGRWTDAAAAAAAAGAAALVIADPDVVPAAVVRGLAADLRIPVIVERPRLRTDVVEDALGARAVSAPRLMIAEGSGPAAALDAVARDACGWLRALAGSSLRVIAGDRDLALLETAAGIAATSGVVATARASVGMRIEVLGEIQTQVDIGLAARVVTTSSAGSLTAPARFETSARLALRRALDALAGGLRPADLDDLAEDTSLHEQLRGAAGRRRVGPGADIDAVDPTHR